MPQDGVDATEAQGRAPACFAAKTLEDASSRKCACCESELKPFTDASDGVVMMAPMVSGGAATGGAMCWLKKKVRCIEAATRMGRQKRLESEYDPGEEIGLGKFRSVRLCRAKNGGGELFVCKVLAQER